MLVMAEYRGRGSATKGSIVFHLHEGVGTLNEALMVIKNQKLKYLAIISI